MDVLKVILFYGGESATAPREQLLNWLRTPRVSSILGQRIEARKVSDWSPDSGHAVDERVNEAIDWADKALLLFTPDARGDYGAPNVLEEWGRWRGRKTGETMAVIRHVDVPVHSNAAGLIYISYTHDVVQECREKLLDFLKQSSPPVVADVSPALTSTTAPPPPKLFVGRDADMAEMERRLMGDDNATVITAVRGWPGIGKTTLAKALAHDDKLKAAFPDGVLWTSLGQQPSIALELGNWLQSFGLDPREFPTPQSRSERLAAILRHRRMLLIVDDVWDAAHAEPFLVGSRQCRMLITTREPEVARALGIPDKAIYKLLVLNETEALALLQELAPKVVTDNVEEARKLVNELERLPLALHVAGRLLAAEAEMGWGVVDLLTELAEGTRLLQEKAPADRTNLATQTTPTIAALLANSTNRLDETTRERFALLGIFVSKPATFDAPAMGAAWGADDYRPTIRTLVNRGLLEPVQDGRFQMHALLVVHAKSMWGTEA